MKWQTEMESLNMNVGGMEFGIKENWEKSSKTLTLFNKDATPRAPRF